MKKTTYFNRIAVCVVALGLCGLASTGMAAEKPVLPGAVKPGMAASQQMMKTVVVEVKDRILTVGASTNFEARVLSKTELNAPLKNVPVFFKLDKLAMQKEAPMKSIIEVSTGDTGVASLAYKDYGFKPGKYPITVEFHGKPGDNSYASATGSGVLTVIPPATKITGFKCSIETLDPYQTGAGWQSNYVCIIEAAGANLPFTELMKMGYLNPANPPKASVQWTIPGEGTKTDTIPLVVMKNGTAVAGTVKTKNNSCADTGSFSVTIKAHVIGDELLQGSEDNQTSFPHSNDWCKGKHN